MDKVRYLLFLCAAVLCGCQKAEQKNIALYKAVTQSSSMDYCYTGQLVTDGIISSELQYFKFSDQDGPVPANRSGFLFDFAPYSRYELKDRKDIFIQLDFIGIEQPLDRVAFEGWIASGQDRRFTYELQGSRNGTDWETICEGQGNGRLDFDCISAQTMDYTSYRAAFHAVESVNWTLCNWFFFCNEEPVQMYTLMHFNSAWVSKGIENEWLAIDFGASAKFSGINIDWIYKAKETIIQTSDDGKNWKNLHTLTFNDDLHDSVEVKGRGRYLRIFMNGCGNADRIAISEVKVIGTGGRTVTPQPQPESKNGRMDLTGGNWMLTRAESLPHSWLQATVPGTVLKSFIDAGAVPDPNYSDNQLAISDSYFYSDFLYRNVFDVPQDFLAEKTYLNFDGINWKADICLNGKELGRIEGAFKTDAFDVTDIIRTKGNELTVLIHKNDHPGPATEQTYASPDSNGGDLGRDNPTFHASVGWDWIPTIRGRNIGIWNDVYLTTKGGLSISEPFVSSTLNLPDTSLAHVSIEALITNSLSTSAEARWEGTFGQYSFFQELTLQAGESRKVSAEIEITNPQLWWPAGYGEQNLYNVEMSVGSDGSTSDRCSLEAGIRQMTYDLTDDNLRIYINGRRFVGRGGNWGFSESNLTYRQREYDIAVAYHAHMNFTMIRNWVGMTGDDEFFQACDRHGIMVWQDFWLANPSDGPDPGDETLFMDNATDFVKRIRNHPSIALYCGRNEGVPPASLDKALDSIVSELHPGIIYFPDSADRIVSGHGPYTVQTTENYFKLPHSETLHSERGMPNVMDWDSFCQTIPEEHRWPQDRVWGIHDYTEGGAQNGANFNKLTSQALGESGSAREFIRKAQFTNYNGYRALFESRSNHRRGLLLWMSHPAWPSMVWQTYDWYFDPTAGFFGCMKACEPLHIQWNPVSHNVEVVNISAGSHSSLEANARIYSPAGKLITERSWKFDSTEDSTVELEGLDDPETAHLLELELLDGNSCISCNSYIQNMEPEVLESMRGATVKLAGSTSDLGDSWMLTVKVRNTSEVPVLMARLSVNGNRSRQRILPAFWSDNYINLLPGEEKTLEVKVCKNDCRDEKPVAVLTGILNE